MLFYNVFENEQHVSIEKLVTHITYRLSLIACIDFFRTIVIHTDSSYLLVLRRTRHSSLIHEMKQRILILLKHFVCHTKLARSHGRRQRSQATLDDLGDTVKVMGRFLEGADGVGETLVVRLHGVEGLR